MERAEITSAAGTILFVVLAITAWSVKGDLIASIRRSISGIKAWMEMPSWQEQLMLDLTAAPPRPRPENDMAKYVKALEALVAEQKKTIKIADTIVEQAQLSARNQADITPALIEEVNRLRVANATLSGAYHWVAILSDDGKKKLVRFSLN